MANKKLTDLTELTTPADGDFLYIVDVSDTTESPQGTSKKIRKDKVDSGASKENLANKQNDLTIDGTGTKYPTVDAVNAIDLQKVIDVNGSATVEDGLGKIGALYVGVNFSALTNENSTKGGALAIDDGVFEISQSDYVLGINTSVRMLPPVTETLLNFPAKTIAGDYTLATTDEISTLDSNVLHKTGDETKTGVLTLVSDAIINGMKIGRGFGSISGNTVLGDNSGRSFTTGSQNTFTGFNVGQNDTTGSQNTFTGFNSGVVNTTGSSNTFMGTNTGLANTIGSGNSFLGQGSGQNNVSGGNNVAIGQNSGRYIADKTTSVTILSNSVMLGYRTSPLANTQTNQTVIGYDATGLGSNTTVIGNSSTVQTWLGGKVTIGTTTDDGIVGNKLQVNGNITSNVATLSNQVVVKSQLDAIHPYKIYTALMTQSGTSAPVATVLENTLGGTVVWTRTSSGSYVGTLAGAFVTNKTVILYNASSSSFSSFVKLNTSNNTIDWQNGSDDRMLNNGTMIEIRVYN